MKYILVSLFFVISSFAFASETDRQATAAEKKNILQVLLKDPIVHAAYLQGRKDTEKCESEITSATVRGGFEKDSAVDVEAAINCSISGNEYIGGGVVYMVHIKGSMFGSTFDHLELTVDHAG